MLKHDEDYMHRFISKWTKVEVKEIVDKHFRLITQYMNPRDLGNYPTNLKQIRENILKIMTSSFPQES